MAKLPDRFKTRKTIELKRGECKYTVPWAMYQGPDGEMYLRGDFSLSRDESGGTATMSVTKTMIKGEIEVDISRCRHYTWEDEDRAVSEGDLRIDTLIY